MTLFTPKMIEVIKNYTQITNSGIVFPEGKTVSVQDGGGVGVDRSSGRTIIAVAELENEITTPFSVFDANQFFSAITMFENPVVEVDESGKKILINDKSSKGGNFRLNIGSPEVVKAPGKMQFPDSKDNMQFRLTADAYQRIFKGVAVVQTPEVMIYGQNGELLISAYDKREKQGNTFVLPVGDTDQVFSIVVKIESINKLLKGTDYDVTINPAGILRAKSVNSEIDVCYYIAGTYDTN